MQYKIFLYQNL